MNFIGKSALAIAMVGAASVASAQTTPAPAAPATPAAPSAADTAPVAPVTDQEVSEFASAVLKVQDVQKDTTIPATDKQTKMRAVISASGLTPERFNEIGSKVRTDQTLMARVQKAIVAQRSSTPAPAAPAPSAGGAQ
ncbi:hypothetical protein GCM10023219_05220 [Stakelama sediminis]